MRLDTLGDQGIELWLREERPGTDRFLKVGRDGCLDVDVCHYVLSGLRRDGGAVGSEDEMDVFIVASS